MEREWSILVNNNSLITKACNISFFGNYNLHWFAWAYAEIGDAELKCAL